MKWSLRIVGTLCIMLIIVYQVFPDVVNILSRLKIDVFTLSLASIAITAFYWGFIWKSIKLFGQTLFKTEKRLIFAFIIVCLLVIHLSSSTTKIDTNALWLIGLIVLMFILPNLGTFIPYIKTFKIGSLEIELNQLKKEVEEASRAVAEQGKAAKEQGNVVEEQDKAVDSKVINEKISADIQEVLNVSANSPRAAIMLLHAKIEELLRDLLNQGGIKPSRTTSLNWMATAGVEGQILPTQVAIALQEFSNIRNKITHQYNEPTLYSIDLLSMIDSGIKLLNTISSIKPPPTSLPATRAHKQN